MQQNNRTPHQPQGSRTKPGSGPGSEAGAGAGTGTGANQTQARRMAGNSSGTAGSQMNRARGSQTAAGQAAASQVQGQAKKAGRKTRKKTSNKASKKQPVDRLGQAVVSLIFGIFGIFLFLLSCIKMNIDSQYSYTTSPGTMVTIVIAYIVNTAGFILGIRARRSANGRGMAIAGITLTALPFVLMSLFIGGAIILTFLLFR
ncbi:hypothetical protein [Paenibacillus fonticola]|uniref:hypothetical protein n=1 Tax=Paenibacillus fonticola TaxID=379896 RepID=UPI00037DD88D|nr:hypothetical protein [Paenibacillus fonticola]